MGVKVSVIMAAYNCEDVVQESVDSILQQSFTDWEFIICDDGSTDGTLRILRQYEKQYPEKIRVIQNNVNSKLPYSLNHCLRYATGCYIARMDADDRSYPERLEKQVAYLDSHKDIDAVGTGMTCFDGDAITGIRLPARYPSEKLIGPGVPFFHATIMMRKVVYDSLGGYSLNPNVLRCEDVDLWMRFFGNGFSGDNIQEPLYYVREDRAATQRRSIRHSLNVSRTLLHGYRKYGYPIYHYIWVIKPIISTLIPKNLKYWINKKRWNNQ